MSGNFEPTQMWQPCYYSKPSINFMEKKTQGKNL